MPTKQLTFIIGEHPTTHKLVQSHEIQPDDTIVGPKPDHAFIESMRAMQLEPVLLASRRGPESMKAELLYVISGGRRTKTFRILNAEGGEGWWTSGLNAIVVHGLSDYEMKRWRSIANNQRTKNPLADLENLRFIRDHLRTLGGEPADATLGEALGMTVAEIRALKPQLDVPPEIWEAALQGTIVPETLKAVSKLDPVYFPKVTGILKDTTHLTAKDVADVKRVVAGEVATQLTAEVFAAAPVTVEEPLYANINADRDLLYVGRSLSDAEKYTGTAYQLIQV